MSEVRDSAAYAKLAKRMRIRLEDIAESNVLDDGEVISDDRMEVAIEDGIDDWNSAAPPLSAITFDTHPAPELLSQYVFAELLRHEALKRIRNGVDFSDGGASVSDTNKAQQLMSISQQVRQEYQQARDDRKVQINLANGFGGSYSDYAYTY